MYYRLVIPEGDETESIMEEFRRAFVSHIKDVEGLPENEILLRRIDIQRVGQLSLQRIMIALLMR